MGIFTKVLGSPIRRVASDDKHPEIFLTFDDGPDTLGTPKVLDLLKAYSAKATFFVIATKAKREQILLNRILSEGHTLGNHSFDHRYGVFFRDRTAMHDWIEQSLATLSEAGITNTVGFRPPVGIRTPHLAATLRKMKLPLVLWSHRSYDTRIAFSEERAKKMLSTLNAGSIVLLHDRQTKKHLDEFLRGLEYLLKETDRRGLKKSPLSSRLISSAAARICSL